MEASLHHVTNLAAAREALVAGRAANAEWLIHHQAGLSVAALHASGRGGPLGFVQSAICTLCKASTQDGKALKCSAMD